jgi:hypothetical protein
MWWTIVILYQPGLGEGADGDTKGESGPRAAVCLKHHSQRQTWNKGQPDLKGMPFRPRARNKS